MDWNEVSTKITDDDRGKWDRKVAGRDLRINPSGALAVTNGASEAESFALSELAVGQLCERLAIPVTYYRRLPGEMRATVANFDLGRLGDRPFLLRGRSTWVRAFLSGEYVAYDNRDIAETVAELLREAEVGIKSFILEETHCYLKITSEEIADVNIGLKAGIMIGNSEVGLGSISVEPFVFRKACTNDLVVTEEKTFRHAHIHLTAYELRRRMAEAVGDAFRLAAALLDTFLKTRDEPIHDPVAVIRKLAEERKLTQKFTDEVVARYVAEPEPNRFGVINAFTAAAQTLAPLQRIEVERFAGSLLTASQ
jgi:hypothetical protein